MPIDIGQAVIAQSGIETLMREAREMYVAAANMRKAAELLGAADEMEPEAARHIELGNNLMKNAASALAALRVGVRDDSEVTEGATDGDQR